MRGRADLITPACANWVKTTPRRPTSRGVAVRPGRDAYTHPSDRIRSAVVVDETLSENGPKSSRETYARRTCLRITLAYSQKRRERHAFLPRRLPHSDDEHDGRKPCGITLRNPSARVIQRIDRRVTCAHFVAFITAVGMVESPRWKKRVRSASLR